MHSSTFTSTRLYEAEAARLIGAPHAVAFGFARHALAAILTAAGLQPGDEVILSPLTCKVVPLALLSIDVTPVYADITPGTLNLDAAAARAAVTPRTRAILFQHTYGLTTGAAAAAALAAQQNLLLVEDCAQCLPQASGDAPGQFGHAAIFSNNLGKPLPAGSGGLAILHDAALAGKVRAQRDRLPVRRGLATLMPRVETWLHRHVLRPSRYWLLFDLNRRISPAYAARPRAADLAGEIHATAFRPDTAQMRAGLDWLQQLPAVAAHRQACVAAYRAALPAHDTPPLPAAAAPLYYYPLLADRKPALLQAARRRRVELIPWPISTPIYPIEAEADLPTYGYEPGCCPRAEAAARRLVGLPTHPHVDAAHRQKIIDLIREHHA